MQQAFAVLRSTRKLNGGNIKIAISTENTVWSSASGAAIFLLDRVFPKRSGVNVAGRDESSIGEGKTGWQQTGSSGNVWGKPIAARCDCGEVTSLYHPSTVSSVPPSWSTYPQIMRNNQLVPTNVPILCVEGPSVV